jgi:adenylosuccinate synthase
MLSDRAHVIFPWHIAEDRALDKSCSSGENIGTTMRGIGPCYSDKVNRSFAVRLGDLYRDNFRQRIENIVEAKNRSLTSLAARRGTRCSTRPRSWRNTPATPNGLRPYVADTTAYLLDAVEAGRRVLFEGAQGALLDVDHGTFPSSPAATAPAWAFRAGPGCPAAGSRKVIGVVKAYSTRVGGGPFPTEQDNDIGQHIRDRGNEYGTVTRRPRRCGWFDAVAVRYTARLERGGQPGGDAAGRAGRTGGNQDLHGV